jgi:hypothetical protein
MTIIDVENIIDNSIAMSTEDGQKLFSVIYEHLKNKEKIQLSFKGVDILISHFLNEAIGKLYEKFDNWDVLDQAIEYVDIDADDLDLLKTKVIPTAKNHFKDIERSEKIEESILND